MMLDSTKKAQCPVHAPEDHPKVPAAKVGILLANLGTPDNYDYWSMRRYLSEFLSDKRVIDYSPFIWQPLLQLVILTKRPFSSGKNYESIWNHEAGESPLMTITKDQTAKIKKTMHDTYGDTVMVDFCMRYGNPSTKSKVREMVEAGCQKILFFPLYPHYAGATSATANDEFFRALMEEKWQPTTRTVEPYFEHPKYIEALAQSIETAYAAEEDRPEISPQLSNPGSGLKNGCSPTRSKKSPDWLNRGRNASQSVPLPFQPTASKRLKRLTKRSKRALKKQAESTLSIFPASTTTMRISRRCQR